MKYNTVRYLRNLQFRIRNIIDITIFNVILLTLDRAKEFGFNKEIVPVDQLGNPDPTKVESFYGNITDLEASERFGTIDIKEYVFWSWRSCGAADVLAILKSLNLYNGSLYDMVKEIKEANGYLFEDSFGNKDLGWKHTSLVDAFKRRNLKSSLLRKVTVERVLLEILNGAIVIVSVKSRSNPNTSHMIIVKSFRFEDNKIILRAFDSYNLDGKGGKKEIGFDEFKNIFLNKGIRVLI